MTTEQVSEVLKNVNWIQSYIEKLGVGINLGVVQSALTGVTETLADMMTGLSAAPVIPDKIGPRAEVWLRAWTAALPCNGITDEDAGDIASSCLDSFDETFPEYLGKK